MMVSDGDDLVDGWDDDDENSDVDEVDGGKKIKYPHVRFGLVGFMILLLAACFLVLPVVLYADPWGKMQG